MKRPRSVNNAAPWTAVDDVAPPAPIDGQDGVAFFGLETFSGPYSIVDGQLIFAPADSAIAPAVPHIEAPPRKKKKAPVAEDAAPVDGDAAVAAPIAPASAWDEFCLHPSLVSSLLALQFDTPTPIQAQALPASLIRGKDLLGCAETGSGKTLAYGLPMMHSVLTSPPEPGSGLACLVLTPTRELAMQVVAHLRAAIAAEPLGTRPRIEALVGGMALAKQVRVLSKEPAVVVASVGRLLALLSEPHLAQLARSLRFLVMDEADRLLDRQHYKDLLPLVDLLKRCENKRQTFLFSATLLTATRGEAVARLMQDLGRRGQPELCQVGGAEQPGSHHQQVTLPASLTLAKIECLEDEKLAFLYYFCTQYRGSVLVFVNTIVQAKRVAGALNLLLPEQACSTLHANMEQKQRLRHLDRFKESQAAVKVLVATDVAARGLDVPDVDYVVHYSTPTQLQVFVHRSGRTARAGKQGLVLALVSGAEAKAFARLERDLPSKLPPLGLDNKLLPRVKLRARLASSIFAAESKDRSAKMDRQWMEKNAKEMELILSDDEEEEGGRGESLNRALVKLDGESKRARKDKELAQLKAQLHQEMKQELWQKGRSFVAGLPGQADLMLEEQRGTSKKRHAREDVGEKAKRKR